MPTKLDSENMLSPGGDTLDQTAGSASAPSSRSNSWKNRHRGSLRREKRRSNLARTNSASTPDCSDTQQMLKRNSLPGKDCPLCTVRSFKTTSKGIVHSGSFHKSLSYNTLFSSGSLAVSGGDSWSALPASSPCSVSSERLRAGSVSSEGSHSTATCSVLNASYFRSLVLGAPGVGKTSLVRHLTRSESVSSSADDEDSPPLLTVELDGYESTMEFVDGPQMSELDQYHADAFIVMYSVSESQSFSSAVDTVNYLRQDLGTDRPVFLVANKTDLVRQRLVSTQEAKSVLASLDCHFLEMSTALHVNVDQLLVATLCRIQQQLTPPQGQEEWNSSPLASQAARKRRSSHGALTALSNFLKHACRREGRGRNSMPLLQVV